MSSGKIKQMIARWRGHPCESHIVARGAHTLSRQQISSSALKVLYRLHNNGYSAYLVGGGVRDLLLHRTSKDFDVVTDATPEQIRILFVNSRVIGRRFQIVHVVFQAETIEVSTFRAAKQDDQSQRSKILFENTFGCLEEDVWRRDFTVNALYYDISDYSIVDHAGGIRDLKKKILRMIGDPDLRFREDPVRLLRAIRFSAKLRFDMDPKTEASVRALPELLLQVPGSRILHEFEKLFFSGYGFDTFMALENFNYLKWLFPELDSTLLPKKKGGYRKLIDASLKNTDRRFKQQTSLSVGFFLGALLWPVFVERLHRNQDQYPHFYSALHGAIQETIQQQQSIFSIPKRHSSMMRSIWLLQFNLERRRPKRVKSLLRHRYFRAAMDLLELRGQSDKSLKVLAVWWRKIDQADEDLVADMIEQLYS